MAEKEYIEREAVIETIKNLYPSIPFVKLNIDKWHEKNKAYMECETAIEKIPAADVRPVKRGRWEYNPGDNIPYCSECMMPQDSEGNFCPNCGADMREES